MSASAALKLNMPAASKFDLCPLALLGVKGSPFASAGKALPRNQIKLLAQLHTASRNFSKDAKPTVADMARAGGISWNAAKNALSRLIAQGLVIRDKKNAFKIEAEANRRINSKRYIVVDRCFNTQKFNIGDKEKKLTGSAVIVLARMKSFYLIKDKDGNFVNYDFKNRKPINFFYSSEDWLSKHLNLPKSTVANAVKELLKAGLLYRNKRLKYIDEQGNKRVKIVYEREITGNTQSAFAVPFEVIAIEQRSTYEPQKLEFAKIKDEFEPTVTESEIEAAYATLRSEAKAKAAEARNIVFADKQFNAAKAEYDELSGVRLQLLGSRDQRARSAAKAEMDNAAVKYRTRLAELGFTEKDLSPNYHCDDCGDTGIDLITGRRCKCRARVVQMVREFKKRK